MPVVRQLVEIKFPTSSATVGRDLMLSWFRERRLVGRGLIEIEQMELPLAFDHPFTSLSIGPAFQLLEFIDHGLVRLLELFIGGGRLIENPPELGCLLECSQQELLALGQIVRKLLGVIHHAYCFNNSSKSRKTISGKIIADVDSAYVDDHFSSPVRRVIG